jgi:ABC-type bacteriocin/lantibiotic exporter with double-glycine peptidase domain
VKLGLVFALVLSSLQAADAVWLDVPFVRQPKEGCGAASLWMVLSYWKLDGGMAVERIHKETYSAEQGGVPAPAMKRYLSERGFRVFDFAGGWEDLREQIGKGRPVIVCLRPSPRAPRHYVVVAGIAGTHALVNDPGDRKLRRVDRKTFEKSWAGGDRWMLLGVPGETR